MQSSFNIWTVLVHDYGTMVSSLLALLTFASLFLVAFAMHRTLASRTPKSDETRLTDKQKRKRKKAHGRGGGKGRIRTSHKSGGKADTVVESRDESETINLPPLSEDKAVISVPLPLKLSIPDCIDSVSSSIDDGGSVATSDSLFNEKPSIVTTNVSESPVAQLIRNSFEDVGDKANRKHNKQQPIAPQQRSLPPTQRNPSLVPSKRWDALKPSARSVPPATRYSKTTWTPPRPKSNKSKQQQQHSASKKQPPSLQNLTPTATTITSDLNPETPEWTMQSSSNNTTPLRPPPGLHHPKDIPFGCSSTDEDDASSWLLLRQLDVGSLDTATDTTTRTAFPSTTLTPPLPPPGLAENDTHDDEDSDAMIEAELQRLGGQMVGSILDF